MSALPRLCVPSPVGLAEIFADLASAFDRAGIRWYVFGAYAALIWGRPRFTADLDVTISLGGVTIDRVVGELQKSGFARRAECTDEFIAATRVIAVAHARSQLPVDVVLGGPGLEQDFLERAVIVEVAGTKVPFISAEDLVVTKLLAGREKDLEDIRGVLAERTDILNISGIRGLLRQVEDALGRSDLVRAFDNEYRRWQSN